MGDIVIETEMEDTVADHGKKTHEKDSTRATVTKRILANCVDIRSSRTLFGLSCGGFLEYQSFIPSSPRGKRYFQQGSMPSPHLCLQFDLHYSHRTKQLFHFSSWYYGNPPSTLWFSSSGLEFLGDLEGHFHALDYLHWVSMHWH